MNARIAWPPRGRSISSACLLALVLASEACSGSSAVARLVPSDVDHVCRAFLQTLASQPASAVIPLLTSELAALPGVEDSLATIAQKLPRQGIDSARIVGYGYSRHAPIRHVTYSYESGARLVTVQVVVFGEPNDALFVSGFHYQVSDAR